MKSSFNGIIIFILYIIISFIKVISLLDFTYPSAISLLNGNIFIVEKRGILVYDSQMQDIIYNYPFQENEEINNLNLLSNVVIKSKRNFVICLINSKIYFFDYEGKLLKETEKIITEQEIYNPTLTPILFDVYNFYYYIISYYSFNNNIYTLKFLYYKINLSDKTNIYITSYEIDKREVSILFGKKIYNFQNKGLSCEYMQAENKDQDIYLVCFFIFKLKDEDKLYLSQYFLEITTDSLCINDKYDPAYVNEINDVKQLQTVTNIGRKNALICLLHTDKKIACYNFYFKEELIGIVKKGNFDKLFEFDFNCRNELYSIKLNYLVNEEKIILSCINDNSLVKSNFFNDNFQVINSYEQFSECESIYSHSIIPYNSSYYIISDVICNEFKRCFEPLSEVLNPLIIPVSPNSEYILEETEEEIKEESIKEETTILIEKKFDCSKLEKCGECDQESFDKNLCISCNHEKNYFYLNKNPSEPRNNYINCVNEKTKPPKFYFNNNNLDYEPCYTTCASCDNGGNSEENNCTSCDGIYYIKNPENNDSSNCVIKCQYFYYIENDIYTCTNIPFCPEDKYLIKDKYKCIENCKEDKDYKYIYNGECFNKCPNNTKDDDDYICKDIELNNICYLTEKEINYISENITFYEVEKLVIKYINEYNYTKNHVSLYKNRDYTITIYINNKCILDLDLGIPEINFGSCYEKIINNHNLNISELIIAIIDKKLDDNKNNRKVIKKGIFSPLTGEYLNSDEICKEEKITIIDSLEDKLLESKVNIKNIKKFFNEGIDVFNLSSPFYNDICFQYNSTKDIALKDRLLENFPNITLCEDGCDLLGINMTSITTICQCFYNEEKKELNLKDKVLDQAQIGALEEMISSSNIYVIKCIKLVFNFNIVMKGYGGLIIFILFIIEIICAFIYYKKNIYLINKYVFSITNKYINYLIKQKTNHLDEKFNSEIKQEKINENKEQHKQNVIKDNITINNNNKMDIKKKSLRKNDIEKNNNNFIVYNNKKLKNKSNYGNYNRKENSKIEEIDSNNKVKNEIDFSYISNKELMFEKKNQNKNSYKSLFLNINSNIDINLGEYLETQYDEMDYDEAIRKDHRKFCVCLIAKLKNEQIIINTFCSNDAIKPRSIKIILLILQINLYFFINGLFYDEKYISNIYHLEKDTFSTLAGRFFDNLIYTALAGIIINYIIEFFFIEENKIKKILKMEKDNIFILKYEIITVLKSIKMRYLLFIIISIIISLIALIHIFCFNIVYNHTMVEWFLFSLIIFISMQILKIAVCLIQTVLRFISFKFKSEKLFKLSLM